MRIALATDATGSDTLAARHARAIATLTGAELVTIHIPPHDEDDVADAIVARLQLLRPELVVLGTHARHGLGALLHGSVAEAVVRNMSSLCLVVPNHGRAFVTDDGTLMLRDILIPALGEVDAQRAAGAARHLLELLGDPPARITVSEEPLADLLAGSARDASLIVMATHGHDGVADVVHGSHTERVIREAACPVLCVPAGP